MGYRRICHTCGKEYEYCPNCAAFESQPKWRANWDTEECKDVWNILVRYNTEKISVAEVKSVLNSYGVVNYSKYSSPIASQLKSILYTEPAPKKNNKDEAKS